MSDVRTQGCPQSHRCFSEHASFSALAVRQPRKRAPTGTRGSPRVSPVPAGRGRMICCCITCSELAGQAFKRRLPVQDQTRQHVAEHFLPASVTYQCRRRVSGKMARSSRARPAAGHLGLQQGLERGKAVEGCAVRIGPLAHRATAAHASRDRSGLAGLTAQWQVVGARLVVRADCGLCCSGCRDPPKLPGRAGRRVGPSWVMRVRVLADVFSGGCETARCRRPRSAQPAAGQSER